MTAIDPPPPTAADLDRLFRGCGPRLARLVGALVDSSDALIEDACQTAWIRLAVQPGVPEEHAIAWLTTTALREARRMAAYADREVPFDDRLDSEGDHGCRLTVDDPHEVVAEHLRTRAMERLTRRQRRLIWLQALGCSHDEIAKLSGCTQRAVHRQLVRARARLREAEAA
jgi:RNA polymerase sigma factor (sigma-70 family)